MNKYLLLTAFLAIFGCIPVHPVRPSECVEWEACAEGHFEDVYGEKYDPTEVSQCLLSGSDGTYCSTECIINKAELVERVNTGSLSGSCF